MYCFLDLIIRYDKKNIKERAIIKFKNIFKKIKSIYLYFEKGWGYYEEKKGK